MKPFLILVFALLLGAGAYYGYRWSQQAEFGVSPEQPLGTFERLDSVLVSEVGLEKERIWRAPYPDIPPTAEMYAYTNPDNESERIILMLDQDGLLQEFLSTSYIGDYGTHSPVFAFARAHWRRLGGERQPELEDSRQGSAVVSRAEFEKDGVKGSLRLTSELSHREERLHLVRK